MNPVFWFLVILALVGVWFALTPVFRYIGKTTRNKIDKTKEVISTEDTKIEHEREDTTL